MFKLGDKVVRIGWLKPGMVERTIYTVVSIGVTGRNIAVEGLDRRGKLTTWRMLAASKFKLASKTQAIKRFTNMKIRKHNDFF